VLSLIAGVLRPFDALSPWGAGEFELLLVGHPSVEAQAIARRIAEHIEARGLGCRIGCASFPRDGRTPHELFGAIRSTPMP
jgi:GGDEF domain-containing protein